MFKLTKIENTYCNNNELIISCNSKIDNCEKLSLHGSQG